MKNLRNTSTYYSTGKNTEEGTDSAVGFSSWFSSLEDCSGTFAEIMLSHLLRHISRFRDRLFAAVLTSPALPASPCAGRIMPSSSTPGWQMHAACLCGCAYSLRWMEGGCRRGSFHLQQYAGKATWPLRKQQDQKEIGLWHWALQQTLEHPSLLEAHNPSSSTRNNAQVETLSRNV